MKTKINKKNDYLLGLFIRNNKGEEIVQHIPYYDLTFDQISSIADRYRKTYCYMVSIYELCVVY